MEFRESSLPGGHHLFVEGPILQIEPCLQLDSEGIVRGLFLLARVAHLGLGEGFASRVAQSCRIPARWHSLQGTVRMAQVPWRPLMADLSLAVRQNGEVAVLLPAGFINAHTVREFEEALEGLVRDGHYTILINCQDLSYISSAGLGAIMGLIETVREHEGDILLSNLQENVFAIFDTLGFTQLYRVFPEEQEALAAAAPGRKG